MPLENKTTTNKPLSQKRNRRGGQSPIGPACEAKPLAHAWPHIASIKKHDPTQRGLRVAFQNVSWFRENALSLLAAAARRGDGVTHFNIGIRRVLVASSHEALKALLANKDFERTTESTGIGGTFRGFSVLRDAIGESLPLMQNREAVARRAWVIPAMGQTQRQWLYARSDDNTRFQRLVQEHTTHGVTDMHRVFSRFVFERLCFVLFGDAFPEISIEMTDVLDEGNRALHEMSTLWTPRAVAHVYKDARTLRRVRARLLKFARQILEALEKRSPNDERPAAAFYMCDFNALDRRALEDEIVTQLVAGTETTSLSLAWSARQISRSKRWYEAMQHEAKIHSLRELHTFGINSDAAFSKCIKEGLRLFPPFWQLFRVAQKDTQLLGKNVPRGTVAFASPLLAQRHPDACQHPGEFLPQRHDSKESSPPSSLLSFGFGTRTCVGARLAQSIMIEALRELVLFGRPSFSDDSPSEEHTFEPLVFGLKRKGGFMARF